MMADPTYQFPHHLHRKPLPPGSAARERPLQQAPSTTTYSHSRTRTTSSSIFPFPSPPTQAPTANNTNQSTFTSKRTPSTGTFSTIGSGSNGPLPARQASTDLRRSTSSRSGASQQPTSYVALMRKQKATVWCDRAQHEDPRLVQAQRAAKLRATLEIHGGAQSGRTGTSGSGSVVGSKQTIAKIRHHGKSNLVGYTPGNYVGIGGVPMRLSATEVEGGDSDDDVESGAGGMHHRRSGSRRSSSSSMRRGLAYARQSGASGASGRWSTGHTPPSEREGIECLNDLAEETPVPTGDMRADDYFASINGSTHSIGSGSSGERADGLADLDGGADAARLASNSLLKSTIAREKSTRNPDELRRRGSVDDRTMTMSTGRLFVANPDVDSD
jgi:hypothetical protein